MCWRKKVMKSGRVGKSRGQYDEDCFEAYETAINAANEIVNVWSVEHDESITIDMINEAKATLEAARDEFHAHVIPATHLTSSMRHPKSPNYFA